MTDVRACPRCGPVVWTIIRDVDHLAAECPRCRVSYDIGWSARGYEAPVAPWDERLVRLGYCCEAGAVAFPMPCPWHVEAKNAAD